MTKRKRRPPAKVCGAKKTNGQGTCGHSAGWGTDHPGRGRCRYHGGNTRSHRVSVQREIAEEAVTALALPREVEPTEALLEELWRTAGWVQYLEAEFSAAELEERDAEERTLLWRMLQEQRRHYVNVSGKAIAAGIAERQVRIHEHQAAMFTAAMRGIFADLGVDKHPKLGKIVRKHMTLIDGGKAA